MLKIKKEKKEEREESLLKELCGDDVKLYDFLSRRLYFDPITAIPNVDLESLIEDAEKSIEDENYHKVMQKYRTALDKALFEATQNLGERARYIKVIQDLASRAAKIREKVEEKEGFTSSSLEGIIKYNEFMSERIEDVIKIASLFYNERLEVLGAAERRVVRRKERDKAEMEKQREEREAKEGRQARRREMGGRERREAEKEDKREEKKEKERREIRREEAIEAERQENRIDEREKERRDARRKEK